ncbi:MAG TPA: glycosyltransferase family 4 protein, partial [Pirellulaceae bacterium]
MPEVGPRVVFLTAGAGGMICGSCLHDNALAGALKEMGVDVVLVPAYTPIRTDELDHSTQHVVYGGINIFLRQFAVGRWIPDAWTRWLDGPDVLRRLTWNRIETDARRLGPLTLSMLAGSEGVQHQEVEKLCQFLERDLRPDLLIFSNLLITGAVPRLKRQFQLPMLVVLQGDDLFVDSLPRTYRDRVMKRLRELASLMDGFLVHSQYYAEKMSRELAVPLDKFHEIPLGISPFPPRDEGGEARNQFPSIGYLARWAPEKGLDLLCQAFARLKATPTLRQAQLHIAGWSGPAHRKYVEEAMRVLRDAGCEADVHAWGEVDRADKARFLRSIDVLAVPTRYPDPKGLYVLEALSMGVPVVQPDHGAFPEFIRRTRGGLLHVPGDVADLVTQLTRVLTEDSLRHELGRSGREAVLRDHSISATAKATWIICQNLL